MRAYTGFLLWVAGKVEFAICYVNSMLHELKLSMRFVCPGGPNKNQMLQIIKNFLKNIFSNHISAHINLNQNTFVIKILISCFATIKFDSLEQLLV